MYGEKTFMSREVISSTSQAQSKTERDTGDQTVHELIAVRAYELFQSRGAIHGTDIDDWLQAEKEILQQRSQPKR